MKVESNPLVSRTKQTLLNFIFEEITEKIKCNSEQSLSKINSSDLNQFICKLSLYNVNRIKNVNDEIISQASAHKERVILNINEDINNHYIKNRDSRMFIQNQNFSKRNAYDHKGIGFLKVKYDSNSTAKGQKIHLFEHTDDSNIPQTYNNISCQPAGDNCSNPFSEKNKVDELFSNLKKVQAQKNKRVFNFINTAEAEKETKCNDSNDNNKNNYNTNNISTNNTFASFNNYYNEFYSRQSRKKSLKSKTVNNNNCDKEKILKIVRKNLNFDIEYVDNKSSIEKSHKLYTHSQSRNFNFKKPQVLSLSRHSTTTSNLVLSKRITDSNLSAFSQQKTGIFSQLSNWKLNHINKNDYKFFDKKKVVFESFEYLKGLCNNLKKKPEAKLSGFKNEYFAFLDSFDLQTRKNSNILTSNEKTDLKHKICFK